MSVEIVEHYGPASEKQVRQLEARMGHRLPPQYREFLLRYNGGRPIPDVFTFRLRGRDDSDGVKGFLSLTAEGEESIYENLDILGERLLPDILPIAFDAFGNLVCISIYAAREGKIYFWDHEWEDEPPSRRNLYFLAHSFNEFLNSLKEYSEAEES